MRIVQNFKNMFDKGSLKLSSRWSFKSALLSGTDYITSQKLYTKENENADSCLPSRMTTAFRYSAVYNNHRY